MVCPFWVQSTSKQQHAIRDGATHSTTNGEHSTPQLPKSVKSPLNLLPTPQLPKPIGFATSRLPCNTSPPCHTSTRKTQPAQNLNSQSQSILSLLGLATPQLATRLDFVTSGPPCNTSTRHTNRFCHFWACLQNLNSQKQSPLGLLAKLQLAKRIDFVISGPLRNTC